MTKLIGIYDHLTGKNEVREMNNAELIEYEADQAAQAALQAEADAKAAQRQLLLDRLGITESEAQLLLGGK